MTERQDAAASPGRTEHTEPDDTRATLLPLAAVIASAATYMAVQGLTYPLLALVLDRHQAPAWAIGVNAAMMPLGMVAAAGVAPRVVARFGLYRTSWCSYLVVGACLLVLGLVTNFWLWIPLRFLTGLLLSCIFVTTDTWVNQMAGDRTRGRVIGIYSMALSAGMALGPGVLVLLGTHGYLPFAVVGVLPLVAVLPIVFTRRRLPIATSQRPTSAASFVLRAPLLLAGVAAAAFADQAAMSLLPVYLLRQGLSEQAGNASLMVMTIGSMALMYPIGWLADRHSRSRLVLACAVGSAALGLLLALTGPLVLFFLIVFLWGGIYYAIYSLSLVQLGDRYSGTDLVAGNAACGAMWGIGGAAGTPLTGVAMGSLGVIGFPVAMAAVFVVFSAALIGSRNRVRRWHEGIPGRETN